VDVTDREAVFDFVERVTARSGRMDVMVNNAGGVLGQVGCPLENVSPQDWEAIFAVNVTGAFYLGVITLFYLALPD
jgi:3-oxoacyl-[acyl-carrier protein] reductase